MRRRAVVSALLLFTTAEASAFAPSTSLISISARSGQAHASGSFARTGASAGGVRMGMERWMPLWRRVLQGPKRLNLVGPFASKAEGIGGRKGGLQNTVQTREVAKAKEEKSVPRLTKAWELLRDIYGQFMVLIFDTLINRPFLHILNK